MGLVQGHHEGIGDAARGLASLIVTGQLPPIVDRVDQPLDGRRWCTPDSAPTSQYRQVVLKFLGEHPARLHEPAVKLVAAALRDAFPCPVLAAAR